MNKIILLFVRSLFFAFLLFNVVSCDDPKLVEISETLEDDKFVFVDKYEDSNIVFQTIKDDSFRTDEFAKTLLGAINTKTFGSVVSSMYFTVELPNREVKFSNKTQFKSIQLQLKYSDKDLFWGNKSDQQTFYVYELIESIYKDTNYYSNSKFAYDNSKIGEWKGYPNPEDSILIIDLTKAFGEKIMNADSNTLNQSDLFALFIKGFFVTAESTINQGSINYFNLLDEASSIILNYDDTSYIFPITKNSARINSYEANLNGSEVQQQLNNSGKNDYPTVFASSLFGIKINLKLGGVSKFADSGKVAVNKAILKIYASDIVGDKNKPKRILLFENGENNKNTTIPELFISGKVYQGSDLNTNDDSYSFKIPSYVHKLIQNYAANPNYKDNGLNIIIPSDRASQLGVFNNNSGSLIKSKLILSYTKLK